MNRERAELRPGCEISRLIRGGWQLAGGHGAIEREAAIADLLAAFDAGIFTLDCADIYTGVEDLIGEFRSQLRKNRGAEALARLKVHTKYVPDLESLPRLRKHDVQRSIDRSLRRLRMERLDLVQFHWWDYAVPRYVEIALWLDELRREGKIHLIGGTNFDTVHTEQLLAAGVPLVAMQVQYSLLDTRPQHGLVDLCRKSNVHLLSYGTVAGGFLSEYWLERSEPASPFDNRSLTKYKLIIDEFGGWELFQDLLRVLGSIAGRHGSDIATVATKAVLDRPQVAAVIVGARNRKHLSANRAVTELDLTPADLAEIDRVLRNRRGPQGDVFALERDRRGPHGSIMKYDLNRLAS